MIEFYKENGGTHKKVPLLKTFNLFNCNRQKIPWFDLQSQRPHTQVFLKL